MEVRPNVEQTIHPRLNVRQDKPLPGSPYVTTSRNKGALNRGAFQMGANLGNWAMPIFYVLLLCWQPPKGSPLIVQSCTDLGATLGTCLTMVEALCHGVGISTEEAQSLGLSGGGMGVRGLLHRNPAIPVFAPQLG